MVLALYNTPQGFALFKVVNSDILKETSKVVDAFKTAEGAKKNVTLKGFGRFENTAEALKAACSISNGKMSSSLKKFLKKEVIDKDLASEKLAVLDLQLASDIKDTLKIRCLNNEGVNELFRGIRTQFSALGGVSEADMNAMQLGLAHSLARHSLKFSPDKVDTMVVQAIGLLDELDKEINTYAMRVREWYGWHFPEMGKVVTDNSQYAKVVLKMGERRNALKTDMSDILDEQTEIDLKAAAQVSMGTEVAETDITNIQQLSKQVIDISDYRLSLWEYLQQRMNAIAPNLSIMVGELVGARLIAHAGSLISLAKQPASTVQILGAEKALFRAIKTKHDTPKYGLIYNASIVGQASTKNKGKISRVLAAKTSLAVRNDALGEDKNGTIAQEYRAKVENRLRIMEGDQMRSMSTSSAKKNQKKYEAPQNIQSYNEASDVVMKDTVEETSPKKKKKKSKKHDDDDSSSPKKDKKKDRKRQRDEDEEEVQVKKKKSKKSKE